MHVYGTGYFNAIMLQNSRVNALRQAFIVTIQQVLVDHLPIILPEVSANNFTRSPLQSQRSFFSCRNSVTDVHFR